MYEPYLIFADNLGYHTHVGNIAAKAIGSKKYQITFFDIFWFHLSSVAALLI